MTTPTELSAQVSELLDFFESEKSSIVQSVANAVAAIPVLDVNLIVDPANPFASDDNPGTSPAPLATIEEAIARAKQGGRCSITLASDVVKTEPSKLHHINLLINLNGHKMTIAAQLSDNAFTVSAGSDYVHYAGFYTVGSRLAIADYSASPAGKVELEQVDAGIALSWNNPGVLGPTESFSGTAVFKNVDIDLHNGVLCGAAKVSPFNALSILSGHVSSTGARKPVLTRGGAGSFVLDGVTNDFGAASQSDWLDDATAYLTNLPA